MFAQGDQDGVITWEEHLEMSRRSKIDEFHAREGFKQFDTDRDGAITPLEFQSFFEANARMQAEAKKKESQGATSSAPSARKKRFKKRKKEEL